MDSRFAYAAVAARRALLAAVILSLVTPAHATPSEANATLYRWRANEVRANVAYLPKRGTVDGPNEDYDLSLDPGRETPIGWTPAERARDARTQELVNKYYSHQGLNRYRGIFIESGAANTGTFQWNTQRNAGLAVKALRDQFLDAAVASEIFNIRLGVNIHELDPKKPATLEPLLDFHREAWRRGISLTDSILFFSGLKNLEVNDAQGNVDPARSFLNHAEFADYAEKMAQFIAKGLFTEREKFNAANASLAANEQKPPAQIAVNEVNEPETFDAFDQFWNGALAQWNDPNVNRLYVPKAIAIAQAKVRIRRAFLAAAKGERVLFFHNEAITPEDYPSHKGELQFAVSQLMLGDEHLMTADFHRLANEPIAATRARYDQARGAGEASVVEACILKFAQIPLNDTAEKVEAARQTIVARLRELRDEHLKLKRETGITAKDDTILMLDYYQQSEFILPQSVPEMIKELSANHGERLKKIMLVKSDEGFVATVRERTRQAESATGQTLWVEGQTRGEIDFEKLLSAEDAIVLDKLVGLRNEWSFHHDPLFTDRRARAHFNTADLEQTDEKRIDAFLNSLLDNNALLLKQSLQVTTDAELGAVLQANGADLQLGSLRAILNHSERKVLHALFGLERARRTGFLPPHYARQTRGGLRKGFYKSFMTYQRKLRMGNIGVGESGGPYVPWAAELQAQMMMSLVKVAHDSDSYLVRMDIGPAIGTVGWMSGPMTGDYQTNGRRGEDGIFKLVRSGAHDYHYELGAWAGGTPWYTKFTQTLNEGLKKAELATAVPRAPRKPEALRTCRDVLK